MNPRCHPAGPTATRRRLGLLALLLLIITLPAGLGSVGATARAAAAPAVTVTPLWFRVPMPDGRPCVVVADLYRPRSATRAHPAPAMLATHGFAGSKQDPAGLARMFSRRGYVALTWSGLGFGGSGCRISLDVRERDGRVGRALVDYLGGRAGGVFLDAALTRPAPALHVVARDTHDHAGRVSRFDPRVGMVGVSYAGGIQFNTAVDDPRIDALAPLITWHDLSYALAPNHLRAQAGRRETELVPRLSGVTKQVWLTAFTALGMGVSVQHLDAEPDRVLGCSGWQAWICPAVSRMVLTGTPDARTVARLRARSVATYAARITAPTLLMQGEGDTLFTLEEAAATYRLLRAHGTPASMIWMSGGHSDPRPAGELDLGDPDPRRQYVARRIYAWFQHHVRGLDVPTGPAFAYFRRWVPYRGDATPAYAEAAGFPLRTGSVTYALGRTARASTGGGVARLQVLPAVPSTLTTLDAADVIDSTQGAPRPELDLPGTAVSFTGPVLTRPLDVVGIPRVRLRVGWDPLTAAGRHEPVVMFLRLVDVGPDGRAAAVRDLVSPVRLRPSGGAVTADLSGIAHRFAAGHRVRLIVSTGSLNFVNGRVPGTLTVRTGGPGDVLTLPRAARR